MLKISKLFSFALCTLAVSALQAQAGQVPSTQDQPAPIVRSGPVQPGTTRAMNQSVNRSVPYSTTLAAGQVLAPTRGIAEAQPVEGVYLRVAPNSAVREVAADAAHIEFRVERGLANLNVHHAPDGMVILVDLPGGQVQPYKNGFYTFNADSKTARVLVGEANVFADGYSDAKPVKLKEDHAIAFNGAPLRPLEFAPFQARADVLPTAAAFARASDGRYPYGYAPFYPYYAWDYPYYGYGWGPYGGWGYPGFGIGFYGGGFYGGGFRGRR